MAIVERRFAVHPRRMAAVRVKAVRAARAWILRMQQLATGRVAPFEGSPHPRVYRRLLGHLVVDGVHNMKWPNPMFR